MAVEIYSGSYAGKSDYKGTRAMNCHLIDVHNIGSSCRLIFAKWQKIYL